MSICETVIHLMTIVSLEYEGIYKSSDEALEYIRDYYQNQIGSDN